MNPQKSKKPLFFNYARYSSIALQMLAIILLCVFAGIKIDGWLHIKKPVFTIILSVVGVVVSIYVVTKDLLRKND